MSRRATGLMHPVMTLECFSQACRKLLQGEEDSSLNQGLVPDLYNPPTAVRLLCVGQCVVEGSVTDRATEHLHHICGADILRNCGAEHTSGVTPQLQTSSQAAFIVDRTQVARSQDLVLLHVGPGCLIP